MAVSVIGELTLESKPSFFDNHLAFSTSNSLNSYVAISRPFLIKALSILEMSVLKEQMIWMLRQSESSPSEIFSNADAGERPFLSLSAMMFSASSMIKIEFGLATRIDISSGLVTVLAMFGGRKMAFFLTVDIRCL